MKSTIIASIATLATAVAADSSCWMTLGQYTVGGAYCVAPLPDFSDQAGCMTSYNQCESEYADCKNQTQSTSACLQLMTRCQIINSFCNGDQCATQSDGNDPANCNLATVNAWNGISSTTDSTQQIATPVVQQATTMVAAATTSTTSTAAALVTPNVPCGQCFTDGSGSSRGLTTQKTAPSGQGMTIQLCMSMCQSSGFTYAGLEYSSECWCGNDFKGGVQPTTGCSMHCEGDTSQTCGGSLLMNVYQQGCAAPTTAAKSTAAAYNYNTPVTSSTTAAAYNNGGYNTPVKSSTTAAAYNYGGYNTPVKSSTTAAAYNYGGYNTPVKSSTTAAAYNYGGYNTPVKSSTTAAAYNYGGYNTPVKSSTPVVNYNVYASKTSSVAHTTSTPTIGICSIPSAYATPVGGYHAPIVACNDLSDYTSSPWKLYNSHTTSSCPVYGQSSTAQACQDACSYQYNSCTKDYASSLNTYSSYSGYKVRRGGSQNAKRTWWLYGTPATNTYASSKDTYSSAMTKCSYQKAACQAANANILVKGTCSSGGVYHAPSTSGSSYNTGYNSYGSSYGSSAAGSYGSSSNSYGGSSYDDDDYWKQ